MSELDNILSKELEELRSKLRFRDPSILQELQTSVEKPISSSSKISFCSNDYLGLSKHPSLRSVLSDCFEPNQLGAGASRLVMGSFQDHLDLEQSISSLVGLPSTLTFSSGYSANVGTIPSLIGPDDIAIVDRQVHASIIDGCRLSRAKLAVFKHLSVSDAERVLSRFSSRTCKKLLITESLFSMSGAYSPLSDLSELCRRYGAFLYVDEAHAIGTIGNQGSGVCKLNNVIPHVLVGTLGKSLGTFGAFVSGSNVLRDFLFNRARSFVFSTAVPPCLAFAAKTGVELAASSIGDSLRCSLESRVALFRKLFFLPETSLPSPIIPWILGGEKEALEASSLLREKGFLVQAIRPPTVKAGTSRLRISISSLHSDEEIERLAASIKSLPFSSAPSAFVE